MVAKYSYNLSGTWAVDFAKRFREFLVFIFVRYFALCGLGHFSMCPAPDVGKKKLSDLRFMGDKKMDILLEYIAINNIASLG